MRITERDNGHTQGVEIQHTSAPALNARDDSSPSVSSSFGAPPKLCAASVTIARDTAAPDSGCEQPAGEEKPVRSYAPIRVVQHTDSNGERKSVEFEAYFPPLCSAESATGAVNPVAVSALLDFIRDSASTRVVTALTFVRGWRAVSDVRVQESLSQLLTAVKDGLELLAFEGDEPSSSAALSAAEMQRHSELWVELGVLSNLRHLEVPSLCLPAEDCCMVSLANACLPFLQHLHLGHGISKHEDTLSDMHALTQLQTLIWPGVWEDKHVRLLLKQPPPALTALHIDTEGTSAGPASSGHLSSCQQLQKLHLVSLSSMLESRPTMVRSNLINLSKLPQLRELTLAFSPRVTYTALECALSHLQLPSLTHLTLLARGGPREEHMLAHALAFVQPTCEVDLPQLRQLTLQGWRLGEADWSRLMRFKSRRYFTSDEQQQHAQLSDAGASAFFALRQLSLLDCSDVGALLPYLRWLPALEALDICSSVQPVERSWFSGAARATTAVYSSPSITRIDTRDFLTLSACRHLTRIQCELDIVGAPAVDGDRDPAAQLDGVQAAEEWVRRARAARPGLPISFKFNDIVI